MIEYHCKKCKSRLVKKEDTENYIICPNRCPWPGYDNPCPTFSPDFNVPIYKRYIIHYSELFKDKLEEIIK